MGFVGAGVVVGASVVLNAEKNPRVIICNTKGTKLER